MNLIVSKLTNVINGKCQCKFSTSLFGLMQFRCSRDDKVVIVQGRLIGLPTINSFELLLKLKEWTKPGPSINVDGTKFFIQGQCIIDNLNTTDCVATTTLPDKLAVAIGGGVAAAILLIFFTVCVPLCVKLKGACKKVTKWDFNSDFITSIIYNKTLHLCMQRKRFGIHFQTRV